MCKFLKNSDSRVATYNISPRYDASSATITIELIFVIFLHFIHRLHQEIEQFYAHMVTTTVEHELRLSVVGRIEAAVMALWPNARVEMFGSFRTGLYLPTSDIGELRYLKICSTFN